MEQNIFDTNLISVTDQQLLDVYSTTVTGIVRSAAKAVGHIKIRKKYSIHELRK